MYLCAKSFVSDNFEDILTNDFPIKCVFYEFVPALETYIFSSTCVRKDVSKDDRKTLKEFSCLSYLIL